MAASAQAAEISELTRKLRLADDEVVRINKRFQETQVMHTLRSLIIYLQWYISKIVYVLVVLN